MTFDDGLLDFDEALRVLQARGPGRMVPDLDRITDLMALLGDPQDTFDTVHVTGTNGKTSTTAIITSLLTTAGLITGSYSSPHLQDLRERIRIAGVPIGQDDLARHVSYLQPFLTAVDERHPDAVTFFEALTALALLHFADVPANVGVLEVGMGGTWDATNVVNAAVAVLTRVSVDHRELGDTPAAIAVEKAGIIKPGAFVVVAEQDTDVLDVITRRAEEVEATLKVAGKDFELLGRTPAVGGQQVDIQGVNGTYNEVLLPLFGRHQGRNAALALAAFEAFHRFEVEVEDELVREAFAAVRSPGRLEPVPRSEQALIVLDGAHNPAGIASLAEALTTEFAFERRVVVLGVLDDKDVEAMVAALVGVADHVVAVPPDNTRAADPERIARACATHALSVEVAADVEEAIDLASGVTRPADGIIVTGSLYLVGEAREALGLDPA